MPKFTYFELESFKTVKPFNMKSLISTPRWQYKHKNTKIIRDKHRKASLRSVGSLHSKDFEIISSFSGNKALIVISFLFRFQGTICIPMHNSIELK